MPSWHSDTEMKEQSAQFERSSITRLSEHNHVNWFCLKIEESIDESQIKMRSLFGC